MIPATELTKRVCGFKSDSSKETVKISKEVETGNLGSYNSLDCILGKNCDIIPDMLEDEPATLIKILKFTAQLFDVLNQMPHNDNRKLLQKT